MSISFLHILIILGAVQGIIISTILFLQKQQSYTNQLLAIFLLLLSLCGIGLTFPLIGTEWAYLTVAVFPFIMVMPLGPLLYFYIRNLINPGDRITKKEKFHFFPIIFDLGGHIIAWSYLIGLLFGAVTKQEGHVWGSVIDTYNTYVDIPRWFSLSAYLYLAYRLVKKGDGNVRPQQKRWAKQLLVALCLFQVIWLVFLIPYSIPFLQNRLLDNFWYFPLYIPLAALIYWIGFKGYFFTVTQPITSNDALKINTLTQENVDLAITQIRQLMEGEKLFLDPLLNVQQLAKTLNYPSKTISLVLNQYMKQNFNQFVNGYRIEEVKRMMRQPANQHLTILGIAYSCGFSSQATFQRAFKEFTNMSPKQYLEKAKVLEK